MWFICLGSALAWLGSHSEFQYWPELSVPAIRTQFERRLALEPRRAVKHLVVIDQTPPAGLSRTGGGIDYDWSLILTGHTLRPKKQFTLEDDDPDWASNDISKGQDAQAEEIALTGLKQTPGDQAFLTLLAEQMVRRKAWQDAARLLAPARKNSELEKPDSGAYPFLRAAVLAHLGKTHRGERAELVEQAIRGTALESRDIHEFPSDRPHDIEALGWMFGCMFIARYSQSRAVLYAQQFLRFVKPTQDDLEDLAGCLLIQHRYCEIIELLRPYIRKRNPQLQQSYDQAMREIAKSIASARLR